MPTIRADVVSNLTTVYVEVTLEELNLLKINPDDYKTINDIKQRIKDAAGLNQDSTIVDVFTPLTSEQSRPDYEDELILLED